MEFAIAHLMRVDESVMHGAEPKAAYEVSALIKWADRTVEGTPYFGQHIFRFDAHVVDEKLHAFPRSPLAQVEVHGKDHSSRAVHAPNECAHALFRRAFETLS